jgi:GMP synthase (glutamine-hydrolysing)
MSDPRLLIIQTGTVAEPVRKAHGDYPSWFMRELGFETPVVRAHEGEKLGDVRFDGIIVTGSPLSVTERAPWMEELGHRLLELGRKGTPVLGVCFGHQLLARAAGGEVAVNPRGREIGTIKVELTPAGAKDPLFSWTRDDAAIECQATHVDAVDPLPPGATLLAGNQNSPVQAYRLSQTIACVQFHPEIDAQTMRAIIAARSERLQEEGRDPRELAAQVRDTKASAILRAFAAQASTA